MARKVTSARKATPAKKSRAAKPGSPSHLAEQIVKGKVLVVVGPGVSLGATRGNPVATWEGLLENGVELCIQQLSPRIAGIWEREVRAQIHSGDMADLFKVAAQIAVQLRGEYNGWLRSTVGILRADDPAVLEALGNLGLPLATTNLDDLLEQVTGLPPIALGDWGRVPGIIHLFGRWQDLVIPSAQYFQASYVQVVRSALRGVSLLFVGYGESTGDPLFRALLRSSDNSFPHFQLCRASDVISLSSEKRLIPVPYGSDYADLAPFLRELRPPITALRPLPKLVRPSPSNSSAPSELDPLLLAFLLVLEGRAKPQLLTQIDRPSLTQAVLAMNLRELEGSDPLLEAQRRLQQAHPDARPNPLWVAWMRATRGGDLQQIAAAFTP